MRIRLNKDLFFIFIVLIFVFSLKNILHSFFSVAPSLLPPQLLEPFLLDTNEEKRKLILLQMVIRHGHRAPYQNFPSNPHNEFIWKEGLQSLTQLGRLQNYVMGKHLQKLYEGFITTNRKEVQVFTSEAARSLYGSYAFMAGLYAPKEKYKFTDEIRWQPITTTTSEFTKLFARGTCDRAIDERGTFMESKLFIETKNRFEHLYRYLSYHIGGYVENCFSASQVARTLNSQEGYNLTSPKWSLLYWEDLQYQIVLNYYFLYSTKVTLRLRVGNLLQRMISNMQQRIKGIKEDKDGKRVFVYSGHGSTITLVLFSLNRYNFLETPMGSSLVLELWKEKRNKYSVRWLLFNSSHPERQIEPPNPLYFDECGGEFCPLEDLINRTKEFIPNDWEKECNYEAPVPFQEHDTITKLPLFQSSSTSSLVSCFLHTVTIVNITMIVAFYLINNI